MTRADKKLLKQIDRGIGAIRRRKVNRIVNGYGSLIPIDEGTLARLEKERAECLARSRPGRTDVSVVFG